MDKYLENRVYFRVTYPDSELTIPLIESFVLIGKNISPEDSEDTWYFQFADDFGRQGNLLHSSQSDRNVVCATRDELNSMLHFVEMCKEVEAAHLRRETKLRRRTKK